MPYHYLRTDTQVVIQLHQGIKPRRPASTFVDDPQWDLIQRCWNEKVEERPSSAEVLRLSKSLLEVWTRPAPTVMSASSLRKSAWSFILFCFTVNCYHLTPFSIVLISGSSIVTIYVRSQNSLIRTLVVKYTSSESRHELELRWLNSPNLEWYCHW